MSQSSQCARILAYLEAGGSLTPVQAFAMFGTLAMHSRAAELRERGHPITCDLVETPGGKRVGCYSLLRVAYG